MKSLIVIDGYNFIFKYYGNKKIDSARLEQFRHRLIDDLEEYKSGRSCDIIVVFDSFKSKEKDKHTIKTKGVEIIFSGKSKTADSVIEKIAHLKEGYDQKFIVTSDNIQQTVILKENIYRKSVREFSMELNQQKRQIRNELRQTIRHQKASFSALEKKLDEKSKEELSRLKDRLTGKRRDQN